MPTNRSIASATLLFASLAALLPLPAHGEGESISVTVTEGRYANDVLLPGGSVAGASVSLEGPFHFSLSPTITDSRGGAQQSAEVAPYMIVVTSSGRSRRIYYRVKPGEQARIATTVLGMCKDADTPDNLTKAMDQAIADCDPDAFANAAEALNKRAECVDLEFAELAKFIASEQTINGLPDDDEKLQQMYDDVQAIRHQTMPPQDQSKVRGQAVDTLQATKAEYRIEEFRYFVKRRDELKNELKRLEALQTKLKPPTNCAKPAPVATSEDPVRPILPETRYPGIPRWICSAEILNEWREANKIELGKAQMAQKALMTYRQAVESRINDLTRARADRTRILKLTNEKYWADAEQARVEQVLRAVTVSQDSLAKSSPMHCPPGTAETHPGK